MTPKLSSLISEYPDTISFPINQLKKMPFIIIIATELGVFYAKTDDFSFFIGVEKTLF